MSEQRRELAAPVESPTSIARRSNLVMVRRIRLFTTPRLGRCVNAP